GAPGATRGGAVGRIGGAVGGFGVGGAATGAVTGTGYEAVAGGPIVFCTHSRMRASSSGARPANRTCASGEVRATNPQHSNVAHDRRTVSPVWNGNGAGAWTPAVVTVACARGTRLPRAPTCTSAGAPRSGVYESATEAANRETNCSFGNGMKSRSLAPALKQSSRCIA